ncbi:hypothetical protein ACVBEF_10875 [Glaciimonas sp. GG7]
MNCFAMMGGHSPMVWVMGSLTLLMLVVLLLGGVVLTKYLFIRGKH